MGIDGRSISFNIMPFGIGHYPPEFNPKIHGPYDPSRFYGKVDKPLSEVKLGELTSWVGRRNMHPLAMGRCVGRAYWRWAKAWMLPKRAGFAPLGQMCLAISAYYYICMYGSIKYHKHAKYH